MYQHKLRGTEEKQQHLKNIEESKIRIVNTNESLCGVSVYQSLMDVFGNRSMVLFVCVYKAHFQILKILAVHMKDFKGERTLIMEKEALGNCKNFV